jgi:soluble lytic murein transglycosylase
MRSARLAVAWSAVLATAFGITGGAPRARAELAGMTPQAPAVHAGFDPRSVRLDDATPEMQMRRALEAGLAGEATRIGQLARAQAEAEADVASTGRLAWLLAASDAPEAERHLRALFESAHPLARWAGLRLAERLRARAPFEASAIARALTTGWAGAARAQRMLDELESKPVPSARAPVTVRSELERAKGLLATQRYEEARKLLQELAPRAQREPELSCAIGLELGRALLFQKKRDKGATHMLALRDRCEDPELQSWARYYAGQAMLRDADPQGAIAVLSELVTFAPGSTLADDALQMQAVAYADQGRAAEQVQALEQIVARYPEGDMRADASFELAMLARARGREGFDQALVHLAALHATQADERVEGQEGRSAYWHARTRQDRGEVALALEEYAALVRASWPSYYAQHALGRIEALDRTRAHALTAELSAPAGAQALFFAYRAEMDDSAFRSAIELLRVGEPARAIDELRFLRAFGAEARDAELSWLGVALLHHAGAFTEATRLSRPLARTLMRAGSAADRPRARALLRIAYPAAFEPALGSAAQEAGISASFLRAIAREESSFDPTAVSPARAYGLVQLIAPTARAYAKPLGLPSDPAALKRPEINLRIGARFMKDLFSRYRAFAPLVPAAYNAGPGATNRWLASARSEALDVFIETIPYRETKRYTRRVLQSFAMYRWLDEGAVQTLPVALDRPPS